MFSFLHIEWQVLYTTQLTQKAKKYHDGFLRLAISGSLGRQVDFRTIFVSISRYLVFWPWWRFLSLIF